MACWTSAKAPTAINASPTLMTLGIGNGAAKTKTSDSSHNLVWSLGKMMFLLL